MYLNYYCTVATPTPPAPTTTTTNNSSCSSSSSSRTTAMILEMLPSTFSWTFSSFSCRVELNRSVIKQLPGPSARPDPIIYLLQSNHSTKGRSHLPAEQLIKSDQSFAFFYFFLPSLNVNGCLNSSGVSELRVCRL